ncbi:cheY-like chemotaxis protein [Hartmannibacter diazotrophicus]|uniref:CheY-like chemotaxis protein n=1 Tax=Hartmannibacter diazotrophicus TaxID=1482074 RepID=A0A2C9DED1_9HYPH|nr:response regulator [Hartmannibacter diazotrophicus]SON58255.1 cheY-like chemotaxis protein [Hartmannibacter diazotrophicus]
MRKKVLTVDDSKTMRDMVAFTLKGAGFDVIEAEDGVKALSALNGTSVDLVITDINMPNMDGVTLVRQLRAKAAFKSTPILILTTEGGDDKKADGRAAGATGWIVKPFAPDKLLSVVNKVCPAA